MRILEVSPMGAFVAAYREIPSAASKARIHRTVNALAAFPDMDSAHPKRSLVNRYGKAIRTMPSGTYLIVYRHDESQLVLLALVPGKLIL